jgi:hypothetical protein
MNIPPRNRRGIMFLLKSEKYFIAPKEEEVN